MDRTRQWGPDILGPGFSSLHVELAPADHGPDSSLHTPRATLIRYEPDSDPLNGTGGPAHIAEPHAGTAADLAVLYIHGWSDYFFHADLARFWSGLGAAFYAVDLRNYGRSLDLDDPAATPGLIESLDDYSAEFGQALAVIADEHPARRIVFHAHSTGGLSAVLWANDNPGRIAGLLLNSPWLEFQMSAAARKLLTPILSAEASRSERQTKLRRTKAGVSGTSLGASALMLTLPNYYTLAVAQTHGKLPFDPTLKPAESFPVYPQFLNAVFAGHQRVAQGLSLEIPTLVQMSQRSIQSLHYTPDMANADIVLNVELLAQRAVMLGQTVVVDRIPGTMHDVFLSAPPARDDALTRIVRFVRGYLQPD